LNLALSVFTSYMLCLKRNKKVYTKTSIWPLDCSGEVKPIFCGESKWTP